MFRLSKRLLIFALAVMPLLFVAAVILFPGPHRAVTPESFGMTEIAPGIFSDAPARAAEKISSVNASRSQVQQFLGDVHTPWRVILCTTESCRDSFGIPGRAITIADMAILTAPSGLNPRTLFHEQLHVELNARMGLLDAIWPRYPSWFNEGLATHLSGTPNVRGPERASDAQWITAAKTPFGWRLAKRGRTPAEYYGAASRIVAAIEDEIGRAGLRRIVVAVANGADFSSELRREMGR